jgi:GlpG protein
MRLLGTLPSETHARRLADYLLTLGIGTRVNPEGNAWEIWVRDDDHMPRAKQEWEPFRQNPDDPRFQTAQQRAAELKKQEATAEEKFRRNQRKVSDLWTRPLLRQAPLTMGLILFCTVIAFLSQAGRLSSPITQAFSFAKYDFDERDPDHVFDYGLKGIKEGQIWRLWTPLFLHFNPGMDFPWNLLLNWHLLLNMLALFQLGLLIEARKGTLWLLAFIIVVGLISNIAQYAFPDLFNLRAFWQERPKHIRIFHNFGGMSGVLFGLFGYLWMKVQFDPEPGLFLDRQSVFLMLIWLVLCMTGTLGSIGNSAHVAGLLAGMAIGLSYWAWRKVFPS